jgi:hypothetical protein
VAHIGNEYDDGNDEAERPSPKEQLCKLLRKVLLGASEIAKALGRASVYRVLGGTARSSEVVRSGGLCQFHNQTQKVHRSPLQWLSSITAMTSIRLAI